MFDKKVSYFRGTVVQRKDKSARAVERKLA
jgi:hypothetical protein